jgi:ubiquitin-protein ligase
MTFDEIIEYNIDDLIFTMKKKNDYYIIQCNKNLDWIESINIYSVNKKPSCDKLVDKINNKINKIGKNGNINKIVSNKNEIELLVYKEMKRLSKIDNTSNSDEINKDLKKIFNNDTVRDMIIKEYIKLWKLNNSMQNVTINDDIYKWNIEFYNINNIDKIKMNLEYNKIYYPYCPPSIKIYSPQLANKLDHRISNSKLFKLEYWNPTCSIINIIDKIKNILMKYAEKIEDFDKNINKDLYDSLLILSSYIDDEKTDEIDKFYEDIEKYIKIEKSNKVNKVNKFKGTGYTGDANSTWKIADYEKIQKTKEFELVSILFEIHRKLNTIKNDQIKNTISKSLLIKFLHSQFNNTTLLDMEKRKELFTICFDILQIICNEDYLELIFEKDSNLYDVFKNLYEISQISAKINQDNDIILKIIFIFSMLEPLYKNFKYITKSNSDLIVNPNNYIDILKPLKFDLVEIKYNYFPKYLSALQSSKSTSQCMKRLAVEISTLSKELPIHKDASIFLRLDEENPRCMRALITGPPDTPYDTGLFVFDIYIPANYPVEVPCVNFINTGGKRFNPNLYACGKVCLSILGTYVGPAASETEKWNTSSTLYQVLISIQSQILVDKPYFNEPGFQSQYNTPTGEKSSKEYNQNVRLFTLQHAIYDFLNENKFKEFDEIIKNHFKLKKDNLIKMMELWLNEAVNKPVYENIINKIKIKLNTL